VVNDNSWVSHGRELVEKLRADVAASRSPRAYLCGADVPGLVAYIDSITSEDAVAARKKRNERAEAAVRELENAWKKPMPCGHTLGDLIGGGGSVTTCGACVVARKAARAQEWLVLCVTEIGHGDTCLWWGPERSGYTTHLEKAGRYTREAAAEIARTSDRAALAIPLDILRTRTVVALDDVPGAWDAIRDYRSAVRRG